jgi:hypothetical protein
MNRFRDAASNVLLGVAVLAPIVFLIVIGLVLK